MVYDSTCEYNLLPYHLLRCVSEYYSGRESLVVNCEMCVPVSDASPLAVVHCLGGDRHSP